MAQYEKAYKLFKKQKVFIGDTVILETEWVLRFAYEYTPTQVAHAIRTNPRTLESWEQGRSKPNPHAVLLMKLVEKFPETLEHLRAI